MEHGWWPAARSHFDLTNDYRGTNHTHQVAAWIHDFNDDPQTRILIDRDSF